jgi:hypothetical protein
MSPPAVNDIIRATVVSTFLNQEIINVFHWKVLATSAASDLVFAQELEAYMESVLNDSLAQLSDEYSWLEIRFQNLTQDVVMPTVPWVGSADGTDISDPLPPQCAANVYWPTTRPRTRATKYFAGYTINALETDGTWTNGVKTVLQGMGDALKQGGTATITVQLGAYNQPLDRFTPVSFAIVPNRARTQRRRRPGVGS